MGSVPQSKRCSACGVEKDRSGFSADRRNRNGLFGRCKGCQRNPLLPHAKRGTKPRGLFARFMEKVVLPAHPDSCWGWRGCVNPAGYGILNQSRKEGIILAHRFSYEHFVGPIPEGLDLTHACDNPPCCNPTHLRPATHEENMAEMARKGRQGTSPLTKNDVRRIRQLAAGGIVHYEIAAQFGVSRSAISKIVARKSRVHVE